MGAETLVGGASPWAAAAQGAGALLNLGIGALQRHQGKKILKEAGDSPTEVIPAEVLQNQEMARLRANTGLPSEQYNQAIKNIQRQQMLAISKSNDRRGGLLTLPAINDSANNATLNLDVANAKARIGNEGTLMKVNNQVAGWRDKVWNNNVKQPWERKYQYGMSVLGSGNQNATTGIDQLAGAGALYGGSGGFRRGLTDPGSNWGLTGYANQRVRQQTI